MNEEISNTSIKKETEQYIGQKVTCRNGKIIKWRGKEIAFGHWPEEDEEAYQITVYQTENGTMVACIYEAPMAGYEEEYDVISAESQTALIALLEEHEWSEHNHFMAALQNTFPDEEIWVEEIQ